MARKAKDEAKRTRERILSSALSLFANKGYDHTTFTDIAARLRMTKGAVYWHFESKEKLLIELVGEMLVLFENEISALLPPGEKSFDRLSFPDVADMMVRPAVRTVSDSKRAAFFMLMHEQIRWSSASMGSVREGILKSKKFGPWEAFKVSVQNDIRCARALPEADPVEIASCCMALWNGLVRSHIDKFLQCDLEATLKKAYAAIWSDIQTANKDKI